MIQRDRNVAIHDFDYQLECYVPAAEAALRLFLSADSVSRPFVGRVDCKAQRSQRRLDLLHLHVERDIRDRDRFAAEFAQRCAEFAAFNDCDSVKRSRSHPQLGTRRAQSARGWCLIGPSTELLDELQPPEYLTSAEDVLDGIERRDKRLRIFDTTVYLHRSAALSGRERPRQLPRKATFQPRASRSDAWDVRRVESASVHVTDAQQLQADFRKYGVADDSLVVLYSTTPHHVGDASVVDAALGRPRERDAARRRLHPLDRRRSSDRQQPDAVSDQQHDGGPQPGLWATREEVLAAVGDGAVCTTQRAVTRRLRRHGEDQLRPAGTHSGQQEPLLRLDPRGHRSAAPTKSRPRSKASAPGRQTASLRIAAAASRRRSTPSR